MLGPSGKAREDFNTVFQTNGKEPFQIDIGIVLDSTLSEHEIFRGPHNDLCSCSWSARRLL